MMVPGDFRERLASADADMPAGQHRQRLPQLRMLLARNEQMRARNLAFSRELLVAGEALRLVQLEDVGGLGVSPCMTSW